MPDWFYRTVSRPLLFRLPPERAQRLACGFMGTIGDLPLGLGGHFIDFLGHMRPSPVLAKNVFGRTFPGPVGMGIRLDGTAMAINAWKQFGFSFIEVGPVTAASQPVRGLTRDEKEESLTWEAGATVSPDLLSARMACGMSETVHCIARLEITGAGTPVSLARECLVLAAPLLSQIRFFSVDLSGVEDIASWPATDWELFWQTLAGPDKSCHWLLVVPVVNGKPAMTPECLPGCAGLILEASEYQSGRHSQGPSVRPALADATRHFRAVAGQDLPIIASGGIHQPADAWEILQAGATLVQIDTGMIYSGPGLPKRINEAVAGTLPAVPETSLPRLARRSWFWTALTGLGMLIGSLLALWMAMTRVVMPYDEAFCGITREQLQSINERLLPFMSHDRVNLAGAMIAIGVLYLAFSWFGSRHGAHWAKVAILASAGTGFFSFFLFLGFGYFDPFHGFVTAVLFQLFVQGIVGELPSSSKAGPAEWRETPEWRRAQWGQFLLVLHSAGLLGAGVIICCIGISDVFVQTDLNYLQTDLGTLKQANPRLIPLVAHDRATLGGMLVSSGLIYLLGSMWGLRRGARWLWHTFLWSGLAAYVCAIGVHFWVGYVDWHHLLPAFLGAGLLFTGLGLCWRWMTGDRQPAASAPSMAGEPFPEPAQSP